MNVFFFLKGQFLQRDCRTPLHINSAINVRSAQVPPYREVVSTGDCTSILPVMCLSVMACKKAPTKRREKKKENRHIKHPSTFSEPENLNRLKQSVF